MAALLQAQADAQPTPTLSDLDTLQQMRVIQIPSTTTMGSYSIQPPLTGVVDNSAVLQRLAELESLVKTGFNEITSKLANTVISVSATPAPILASAHVPIKGGGRRHKTKRSKRKLKMRSK